MPSTSSVIASPRAELGGDVDRRVVPVGRRPPGRRSRRGGRLTPIAANTATSRASSAEAPTVRTESSAIVVRSASAPTSMRPASGHPRLAWPPSVAARSNDAASWLPRMPLANRSSSSTARASSSRSITACESLPRVSRTPESRIARAAPMPSARSRSVVGHRQHHPPAAPSRSRSASAAWVACTAVNRSVSACRSASTCMGVRPRTATHWSCSAGCSDTWACSGASRSAAHAATTSMSAGSTARTECTAAPMRRPGSSACAEARVAQASTSPSENRRCVSSAATSNPPWR